MQPCFNIKSVERKPIAIYVHIPFCVSKCAYCDFYSIPCKLADKENMAQQPDLLNGSAVDGIQGCHSLFSDEIYSLQKRYVHALIRQMRIVSRQYRCPRVSTVFIGGGTPSVLKTEYMQQLIKDLYHCFDIADDAELTVEVNPDTVDEEKLSAYKKMGINRLSIGMQSAVDSELRTVSRIHTFESVKAAVKGARAAGFDNVNLDIMYALPSQTLESFKTTLDAVLSLSPEHVSVYGLQLEEGTPLFKNRENLAFPGEDAENEMNALALDILEKNGYSRYEISNYAKEGFECRHNLTYWTQGEYVGFGVAAHSFKDGKRFSIKKDIEAYCNSLDFSELTETEEILSNEELTDEYVMLSLRLCRGLSVKELKALTESAETYLKRAEPFIKSGFMELYTQEGEEFLHFTHKGFNVSNTVLSEILNF